MKFLSATFTLSLKFIFFATFTLGTLMLSILFTYLHRPYFENHFADKFTEIQSKHIQRILEENQSSIPFGISAQTINATIRDTFSKENIKLVVGNVFDTIENYEEGETITFDLSFLKAKEAELINRLASEVKKEGMLGNEAKAYLSKNINLGIPLDIELETSGVTGRVLNTVKFIITNKLIVILIVLSFMFIPLIGIFALNAHPYYKGLKKSGVALIIAGGGASVIELVSGLIIKSISMNDEIAKSLEEVSVSLNSEMIESVFDFAFGKALSIITIIGLITLFTGLTLYVISRVVEKKYEYT